jgi:transcriptional antiterminator NusG
LAGNALAQRHAGWCPEWELESEAMAEIAPVNQVSVFAGMRLDELPQWFAVRTRSRHEKRVASQTNEKGICTFLPLLKETHHWSDRRKRIDVPLFHSYIFVRICLEDEARLSVLRTFGVVGFVGTRGRGISIPAKQIEDIRLLVERDVPLEPYPFLAAGQRVRIRGGAMDGVEGILVAKNADRSLVVSVQIIQKSLSVRIAGYEVEPV